MDLRLLVRLREDQRRVPHLKRITVVAGALQNARGEILLAQRTYPKNYAGQWEFPGGKHEPGESSPDALRRELAEELGIEVRAARPLILVRHTYPEFAVELETWRVTQWDGEVRALEGQPLEWVAPARLPLWPLLPADGPIATALRLPEQYVFTPPDADAAFLLARLPRLPRGALLRLRLPQADDAGYAALARALAPACSAAGLLLMLDRAVAGVDAGWHAPAASLAALRERPVPPDRWFAASCHDAVELDHALRLGADFIVAGPVRPTATHPGTAPLGWPRFRDDFTGRNLPAFAIGGLGPGDLGAAWQHGAQGVAGISAWWR